MGLGAALPAARAATIHVATTGYDLNDGLSWPTAKQTVTAGLAAATAGDEVWVAEGVYVACIELKTGVALYGGFTGNESQLTERNWVAHVTVLDGGGRGSVVTPLPGATTTTRIDGFTIRNGLGRSYGGGGIYCNSSSPTISHNVIVGNEAMDGCLELCAMVVLGESYGGGIYCIASSPVISNNVILGNTATSGGGGIYCRNSSFPVIVNNTIVANTGGGITCDLSAPQVLNNIVAFNSSGVYASGRTPTLGHNCVYNPGGRDYSGLTPGSGDTSADPQLVNAEYGQVHLAACSPCIEAGNDVAVTLDQADVDGQSRIQGAHIDIGADEFDGTTPTFAPQVIHVSPEGDNAHDGSSWESAKRTVQAGIDAAAAAGGADVWVATGTYPERIVLPPWVHVYGGFAGMEDERAQRDWTGRETILSGGGGGSVVTALSGCRISRIDGFTIRDGNAKASTSNGEGGGIRCYLSAPFIANNRIVANTGYMGGGIACRFSSSVISNNTISGNTAVSGGGIYCQFGSPIISGNLIEGNTSGGVWCVSSSAIMLNNTIQRNDGSGVYCQAPLSSVVFSPVISNNLVRWNQAAEFGGGVCCLGYTAPIVSNNTVTGNTAGTYGGGILGRAPSSPAIRNNVVCGNSAGDTGGGICAQSTKAPVSHNTIVGNTAPVGGGLHCVLALPVENNIVAFNSSGISALRNASNPRNNCVYNPGGYDYDSSVRGEGDISVDPRLVATEFGEVHLKPTSPCIDAGYDANVQPGWTDLDGQPRIQNAHVDIGADEFDGTALSYQPAIVRVSPTGDDAHDGSSWSLAKRTVQAGIETALVTAGEVWAAEGTYHERISLKPFVHVYGGFAGTEEDRDQRDWRIHMTILDGDAGGSVVQASAGSGLCAVDGFVIRNGIGTQPKYGTIGQLRGGGIDCDGSLVRISNNVITGNVAYVGGGIACGSSSLPTIANNKIVGNAASSIGGGIACNSNGSPTIANSIFVGNSAGEGRGEAMYVSHSQPVITNCTFSGDLTVELFGQQSALPTRVTNCILWGNGGASGSPIHGAPSLAYCDIEGGYGGTGNIDIDPRFVRWPSPGADGAWGTADDDYGDLRLSAGSPCIDAGTNSAATAAGLPVDLDGHGRFVNDPATPDCTAVPGTCGTAPIVDMGAYEFIPGDYDRDGDVDGADFAAFQACVSGPAAPLANGCVGMDFDRDGDADQDDFGVFQRCFSGADRAVNPNGC